MLRTWLAMNSPDAENTHVAYRPSLMPCGYNGMTKQYMGLSFPRALSLILHVGVRHNSAGRSYINRQRGFSLILLSTLRNEL